jgi:hypothetical protein
MSPIQPGGITPGILYVVFKNIDANIFKSGADVTVNYEDVFSTSGIATIKVTGRVEPIGTPPGLHTNMVCPAPPGGLSKLLDATPSNPK